MAEAYLARSSSDELGAIAYRVRSAARELAAAGTPVHYLRSTFVPEDETCFHLFEASSADAVSKTTTRAGIGEVRVVGAIREETTPRRAAPAQGEGQEGRSIKWMSLRIRGGHLTTRDI